MRGYIIFDQVEKKWLTEICDSGHRYGVIHDAHIFESIDQATNFKNENGGEDWELCKLMVSGRPIMWGDG
jgi:hypothetical protein